LIKEKKTGNRTPNARYGVKIDTRLR